MWACTYRGGVLLLLVQPGAAPLLTVAVLLQRVENLIRQLQIHPQPVANMDLWCKLQGKYRSVTTGDSCSVVKGRGQGFAKPVWAVCVKCVKTLPYVVHPRRVLAAACHLVVFGRDVLAFTRKASAGGRLRFL